MMTDNTVAKHSKWEPISLIKTRLFDLAILVGTIFAGLAAVLAVFISDHYVGTTNFYFDIFSIGSLLALYAFRRSLPLKIKVLIAIGFIYIIFITSTFQYGTISNQKNLITLIPFLLILVFDFKTAFIAFIALMMSYFIISFFFISGTIVYEPTTPVNANAMFWVISGMVAFATGLIIMFMVHNYNKEIAHALTDLETTTAKLELRDQQRIEHLKEKNIMIQEIHHRVKNNLAVVSGLLELQMKAINDDTLTLAMQKSINRILSIAKVHQMLYQSEDFNKIPFKRYVDELADVILATMNSEEKGIQFDSQVEIQYLNINHSVPLGIIFNELITNSIKYGFQNGSEHTITISVKPEGELVRVTYQDNGVGIEDFEQASSKSLGFSLITSLLTQIDATHRYETEHNFTLEFSFPAETQPS